MVLEFSVERRPSITFLGWGMAPSVFLGFGRFLGRTQGAYFGRICTS
jgi:hypothetical protein